MTVHEVSLCEENTNHEDNTAIPLEGRPGSEEEQEEEEEDTNELQSLLTSDTTHICIVEGGSAGEEEEKRRGEGERRRKGVGVAAGARRNSKSRGSDSAGKESQMKEIYGSEEFLNIKSKSSRVNLLEQYSVEPLKKRERTRCVVRLIVICGTVIIFAGMIYLWFWCSNCFRTNQRRTIGGTAVGGSGGTGFGVESHINAIEGTRSKIDSSSSSSSSSRRKESKPRLRTKRIRMDRANDAYPSLLESEGLPGRRHSSWRERRSAPDVIVGTETNDEERARIGKYVSAPSKETEGVDESVHFTQRRGTGSDPSSSGVPLSGEQLGICRSLSKGMYNFLGDFSQYLYPVPATNCDWYYFIHGTIKRYYCDEKRWKEDERVSRMATVGGERPSFGEYSNTGKYILVGYDVKGINRYSEEGTYVVYDLQAGRILATLGEHIDLAVFSPNDRYVAFVKDRNVYITGDLLKAGSTDSNFIFHKISNKNTIKSEAAKSGNASGKNEDSEDVQNGMADWLYEEEVMEDSKALWWSPNDRYIAYLKFDDSKVNRIEIQYELNSLSYRYPEAGGDNPEVRLIIYDPQTSTDVVIDFSMAEGLPPRYAAEFKNPYVYNVAWLNNDLIMASVANRNQNQFFVMECRAKEGGCKVIHSIGESTWVEKIKDVNPSSSSKKVYFTSVSKDKKNPIRKINVIHFQEPQMVKNFFSFLFGREEDYLATGKCEVISIESVDEAENMVYYVSSASVGASSTAHDGTEVCDSKQRHLWAVDLSTRNGSGARICLTCEDGIGYYAAKCMSSDNGKSKETKCLVTKEGPGVPFMSLKYLDSAGKGPRAREVEYKVKSSDITNKETFNVAQKWYAKSMPATEFINVPSKEVPGGIDAKVSTPLTLDKKRKYPVLVEFYGGPNSNDVSYKHEPYYALEMTQCDNIVQVHMNPRGTGFRGAEMVRSIYKKLGLGQVDDIISVGQYLTLAYPWVDHQRLFTFGWSYGGFLSAATQLHKGQDNPYKGGVAVAPVTDWRYYDSAYTERYMGYPPSQNSKAWEVYDATSLVKLVANGQNSLESRKILFMHGTGDDNVHVKNTLNLVKALSESDGVNCVDISKSLFLESPTGDDGSGLEQKNTQCRVGYAPFQRHGINSYRQSVYNAAINFVNET